uniref:N-acetylmuramidase domain-containing protein n=1 Tax=Burkholderia alba TaxID=2683677 RepID=UPI002B062466
MKEFRLGDRGDDVGLLQRHLLRAGYTIPVTGLYDDATEAAIVAFQIKTGLAETGIAGPRTLATLATGLRDPKHLSGSDFLNAAGKLGVSTECLFAIYESGSHRFGFLLDGRPVIRFEQDIFWERLRAHGINPGPLENLYRGTLSPWLRSPQREETEYARLRAAEVIDARAACESTRWGGLGIIGYHWKRMGYATVDDFVSYMEQDEGNQLDAFVRYIKADSDLVAALKAQKWGEFTRNYNGFDYAYHL